METNEDVDRHARAGLILPCVIEHRYPHRKITESRTGTLGTLNRLLADCGPHCLTTRDGNTCIQASRRATHVFLVVICAPYAKKWCPDDRGSVAIEARGSN
ncbi:hypothetical protein ISCGN_006595 [Ixodes scapularis]